MLIVRGLLVALAGFTFVFLPGGVISALTRRDLRFETSLLLWGMGLLVVTLFPALFLTSLIKIIIWGQQPPQGSAAYWIALVGSIMSALFLIWGQYLFLRWRKVPAENLPDAGMLIGLGVGVLTNIFLGMGLIGSGLRLVFGDTSTPDLAAIAAQPWPNLILGVVALNAYRLGLVAVSAALGLLVARTLIRGEQRWLWLAVAISALTAWTYNVIGLALGSDSLIGGVVVIVYEGVLAAAALGWLLAQMDTTRQESGKPKQKKAAAAVD